MSERRVAHVEGKREVAAHAVALIAPGDFVYLDSGTTVGALVERIRETDATYVTNSVAHAQVLLAKGCRVLLPAGELKPVTEAIVGEQAIASIRRYHFTIGFFGVNGITPQAGFTTPEIDEALIKEAAMRHTLKPYVLADASKFQAVAPVTFGDIDHATIICDDVPPQFADLPNIVVASHVASHASGDNASGAVPGRGANEGALT